ncbi:hypothetical protein J6590_060675 [Homalodisca vitripennis]|nr:hypothetical protein J6590_060675 [Homalodisca vitripennis]
MPLARYTCTGWLVLLFLMSSRGSPHSPLTLVNPWLSSCDLHQPSPPDLQGSCSRMISEFPGPPPSCPPPCSSSSSSTRSTSRNSDNTTQCLEYLNESHKTVLCGAGGGGGVRGVRLRHCCEHSVHDSLSAEVFLDNAACERAVQALIDIDRLAARLQCEFAEVLSRYDCGQSYSVNFHCDHCQVERQALLTDIPSICNTEEKPAPEKARLISGKPE